MGELWKSSARIECQIGSVGSVAQLRQGGDTETEKYGQRWRYWERLWYCPSQSENLWHTIHDFPLFRQMSLHCVKNGQDDVSLPTSVYLQRRLSIHLPYSSFFLFPFSGFRNPDSSHPHCQSDRGGQERFVTGQTIVTILNSCILDGHRLEDLEDFTSHSTPSHLPPNMISIRSATKHVLFSLWKIPFLVLTVSNSMCFYFETFKSSLTEFQNKIEYYCQN